MMCATYDEGVHGGPTPELERLAAHIQGRLGSQVRHLRLLLRDKGLILQGRARTYYVKQLTQHAVMQATHYPILANEIEVT
jgi:hypothetical protein